MKKIVWNILILIGLQISSFAQTSTFENQTLAPESNFESLTTVWFTDGAAEFQHLITTSIWGDYFSNGFVYSNKTDVTNGDYTNQFSVIAGKGVGGSSNYAVAYDTSIINLTGNARLVPCTGFYVCNTTYGSKTIQNGYPGISKKFGGDTGNDPDYFILQITGFKNQQPVNDTVKFYLADYRFDDNSKDYIVNNWRWVDLRKLGAVDSLKFFFSSSDEGAWGINTPLYFAMDHFNEPLYDPSMSNGGVNGIAKNSSSIVAWGTSVSLTRGYLNINDKSSGFVTAGTENNVIGAADGTIVSLGDSGVAVIQFDNPIMNGPGADFVVFENGFNVSAYNDFVELAFVEVSSDGSNFFRFPAVSKTNYATQIGSFGTMDVSLINNLAGKYVGNYGTPFNLDDIPENTLLDKSNITHVKIIDVIGSIYGIVSKDSLGNIINDPYMTNFASGGFDLDAVGVIHQNFTTSTISKYTNASIELFPNPTTDYIIIKSKLNSTRNVQIYNSIGVQVWNQVINNVMEIEVGDWSAGVYYIKVQDETIPFIKY
jgi:hypothetical protein